MTFAGLRIEGVLERGAELQVEVRGEGGVSVPDGVLRVGLRPLELIHGTSVPGYLVHVAPVMGGLARIPCGTAGAHAVRFGHHGPDRLTRWIPLPGPEPCLEVGGWAGERPGIAVPAAVLEALGKAPAGNR